MVRTYKKKTNRGNWSKESMLNAVDKVLSKEMGYRKAALQYGVPQTTLERKVKMLRTTGDYSLIIFNHTLGNFCCFNFQVK